MDRARKSADEGAARAPADIARRSPETTDLSPAGERAHDLAQLMRHGPAAVAQRRQLRAMFGDAAQLEPDAIEPRLNATGLPDALKSGVEALSGLSLDGVKVHYNSPRPAQMKALAYAQGHEIHIGPGQERHLPHEAWHVVQQAQGRVRPTTQLAGGIGINDDEGLEREADLMGERALRGGLGAAGELSSGQLPSPARSAVQGYWKVDNREIRPADVRDDPVGYLLSLKGVDAVFIAAIPPDRLLGVKQELIAKLGSAQPESVELLYNQIMQIVNASFGDDSAEMNAFGHDGDDVEAPLLEMEIEEIPLDIFGPDWVAEHFTQTKVSREVRAEHGAAVLEKVIQKWRIGPVMTRLQVLAMAREVAREQAQSSSTGATKPILKKRGPGRSGPNSYFGSSNGFAYTDVSYTRDAKGYFDFAAPTNGKAWTTPVSGAILNLQASSLAPGHGIMPSGGAISLAAGSRAQHFAIANRLAGNAHGANSPPGLTWHHLDQNYKMVLVDREAHRRHGHNGGKLLWT